MKQEGSLFCHDLTVLEPLNIPFRGSLTETEKKNVINQIKLVLIRLFDDLNIIVYSIYKLWILI